MCTAIQVSHEQRRGNARRNAARGVSLTVEELHQPPSSVPGWLFVLHWCPNNISMIFGGKGLQFREIRASGGWNRQRLRGLAHFGVEVFQARWNGELQEPGRLTALDQEAMGDLLWEINEGSGLGMPAMLSADEGELSIQDIERLVLSMVHVQRRCETRRQDLLNQAERLTVIFSGRFE
jgi:hypothetical protein